MSPPNLSTLPVEIKCQIMEASDNISIVLALAQTASAFQQVWRSHTKSICQHVLPRTVECYDESQTLVEVESQCDMIRHQARTSQAPPLIGRFERTMQNACIVKAVCELFSSTLSTQGPTFGASQTRRQARPYLTPTERTRFIHTYYVAMTYLSGIELAALRPDPHHCWPDEFLASISPRELWRVRELMSWLELVKYSRCGPLKTVTRATNADFAAFRVGFRRNFWSLANRDPYPPGVSHNIGISPFFDECQHFLECLAQTNRRVR